MCGVAGFFVGCSVSDTCPLGKEACKLVKNANTMRNWYEQSTVRRAPRRTLNEDDLNGHLYPMTLAPVTQHPLVTKLDGEQVDKILTNHLYRYLDFTVKLEVSVVNDVVRDIALDIAPFKPEKSMMVDALKIYTDEGYHALFSLDLANQIEDLTEQEPILPRTPRFLKVMKELLDQADDAVERSLYSLWFVIVSEMLITGSLKDHGSENEMPSAVRDTLKDHMRDEARHHAFFSGLLLTIWPKMNHKQRTECLSRISDFILAFVHPDTDAIETELTVIGMSPDDAKQVVAETYTRETVAGYARDSARSLLSLVSNFDEFHDPEVQDRFQANLGLPPIPQDQQPDAANYSKLHLSDAQIPNIPTSDLNHLPQPRVSNPH